MSIPSSKQQDPAPPRAMAPPAAPPVVPPVVLDRVPWKRVLLFGLIAYAVFALFALPFWFLPGGIENPLFTPVIAVGMWSPAIASVIMAKAVERTSWRTRVGLRFRGRWRGIVGWSVIALVVMVAIFVLCAGVMALRGVPADLTGGTSVRAAQDLMREQTGRTFSTAVVWLINLFTMAAGLLVTAMCTLGEEIGWRGWLWPALKPLGRVPAALLGGVIWALWHLPILLLGYNYSGEPRILAIPFFTLFCMAVFTLLGALTDRAGGNPIPAALAHAAINSWGAMILAIVFVPASAEHLNPFLDGHAGIVGIALTALAGAVLMPWGRLPIVRGRTSAAAVARG